MKPCSYCGEQSHIRADCPERIAERDESKACDAYYDQPHHDGYTPGDDVDAWYEQE